MILATYQCLDYLTWKNKRYSKLKEILGVSNDTNLYWCIAANNIYQVIINTYTVEINQPALFVLFETSKFYRLDAIKWNHYVETQDESLLTDDLLNIEHEDAIEYIVTDIPKRKFEVNTTPGELTRLFKNILSNSNHEYYKSLLRYMKPLYIAFNSYPDMDDFDELEIGCINNEQYPKEIMLLQKYFLMFKTMLLPSLYFMGMDYLKINIDKSYTLKTLSIEESCLISIKHASIYKDYKNINELYSRYKDFYELIYKYIFISTKIYPNELCPCGSGIKYKKCCMKNNKLLYRYLIEK